MTIPFALTAYSRFGLGPRLDDLSSMSDPRSALLAELAQPDAAQLSGQDLSDSATLYGSVRTLQAARKMRRQTDAETTGERPVADGAGSLQQITQVEAQLRIRAIKRAEVGFVERLVAFWTNHFALETGASQLVNGLAGAFEREAIRPNVLGKFGDMALAATRHPAMLIYLNNAVSVGPGSRLGERRAKGLNENHARELMELHTLGVDGGYDQADVTAFANVLTGWSVGTQPQQPDSYGQFLFRRQAHEPGAQTIMGTIYPQNGLAQGEAVLSDWWQIAQPLATSR